MLKFNELRIDSATKNLIIDASMIDIAADPNHDLGIDYIYVGIGSNINVTDYRELEPTTSDSSWNLTNGFERINGTCPIMRGFRLVIDLKTLSDIVCKDAEKQLIYVKVGVNTEDFPTDLPCSLKKEIEGYVYDRCILYNPLFDYLKISDTCADKGELANYIAQIKGLELAVESGRYDLANKYWNKFFINNNISTTTGCCCH